MTYKILVIESGVDCCECSGECYCEPEINTHELCLTDLARSTNYELKEAANSLVVQALQGSDETLRERLRQLGWVNLKEIKDREEKLAAGKQFWMYQGNRIADNRYGCSLSPVDLENLSVPTVRMLAREDTHIVQTITKPSLKKLFNAEQKKVYDQVAKQEKKEKEKKAAAAKTKLEKKKQREIAKAKKILAEAGETNDKP